MDNDVNNANAKDRAARTVETVGSVLGASAGAAATGAVAHSAGVAVVAGMATTHGAAAGITGLTAGMYGVPAWLALTLANPLTAFAAAGVGAAVGGYVAYRCVRRMLK